MPLNLIFDNLRVWSDGFGDQYLDEPLADPLIDPFSDVLEDVILSHIRNAGLHYNNARSGCGPCCFDSDVESDAGSDNGPDSDAPATAGHGHTQPTHSTAHTEQSQQQTHRSNQGVRSLFFIKPCRNHDVGHVCTPRHRMRRMMRRWKRRATQTANKAAEKARHGFGKLMGQAAKATSHVRSAALVASATTFYTLKNALTSVRDSRENKIRAEARARIVRRKRANAIIRSFDLMDDVTEQDALELTNHDVAAMVMDGGHSRCNDGNETETTPLLLK